MTVKPLQQFQYEELLATYSHHLGAIALLKEFRPYLEMVPSMRRPDESVISIPFPIIRVRSSVSAVGTGVGEIPPGEIIRLPCDTAILMCDPEWKIKTGVEIFIFIHRPHEDFSDLLARWRQTQIWLDKGYEWIMPYRYQHILSEGADETHPLFVLLPETPDRIKRGLKGAYLPFVVQSVPTDEVESSDVGQPSLPTEAS
jgi:hypothetical protein